MDRNAKIYWTYGKFKIVDDRTVRPKVMEEYQSISLQESLKVIQESKLTPEGAQTSFLTSVEVNWFASPERWSKGRILPEVKRMNK